MKDIDALLDEQGLKWGELTFGDICLLAEKSGRSPGEMAILEASRTSKLTESQVGQAIWQEFSHNLSALNKGLEADGASFLFGRMASELSRPGVPPLTGAPLLEKSVKYTFATQVGNHCVGLRPCAGTGDSCSLTGLAQALKEQVEDMELVNRALASMLKIAVLYRVAKTTTGCNLEGFGAGAAAAAAAFSEIFGCTPSQTERAVVLAISPTIGVPCTPRVMVPGLCATHIGGAVMIGWLSAYVSRHSNLPVNVPVDLMFAMAAAVHPVSAQQVVPVVIKYMEPFFKINQQVETFISEQVKIDDEKRRLQTTAQGLLEARAIAAKANSIIKPFGEAVVGGSSQAVGSPANAARIAHALAKGKISKIVIELYPELFARRAINIPAILMSGVYGAATDDARLYLEVIDKVKKDGVEVEILEAQEHQLQKVSLTASAGNSMVAALNRGGGRLVLSEAAPSLEEAVQAARRLGVVLVDG
ncbi:MAG: serine dehydratase [Deltaproteobacteria bacterium]|jgi:L-serine dehydratase|nr:serine dehydratase [Deltaproteobacteria bacterium]